MATKKTGRDEAPSASPLSEPVAYTVEEFCRAHGGIARSHFYDLVKEGQGPRLMKAGRRTLVSREAAADWRRRMERQAGTAA